MKGNTMTKQELVKREREQHHAALEQLAKSINPKIQASGLQLWRKLNQLEILAHAATTAYCNGEIDGEQMDTACESFQIAVAKVFGGTLPPRFHVNRDPRGYALKLLSSDDGSEPATEFALYQDWGRNQILAPTID